MPPKQSKGQKEAVKGAKAGSSSSTGSPAALAALQVSQLEPLPWSPSPVSPHAPAPFTVASWNVLADDHTYPHYYPQLTKQTMGWAHRHPLLLNRLRQLNPDIICLQEVDHWRDWEEPLAGLGYENTYLARGGSKQDGCSISYKSDRFLLVDRFELRFDDLANFGLPDEHRIRKHCVALGLVLRPLDAPEGTGERMDPYNIFVVTTHLFWNPKFEDVKIQQAVYLTYHISQFWPISERLILCGDMNSTPDSALATFLRTGQTDLRDWSLKKISGDRGYKGGGGCYGVFGLHADKPASKQPIDIYDQFSELSFEAQCQMLKSPILKHGLKIESVYQQRNGHANGSDGGKKAKASSSSSSSSSSEQIIEPITSHFKQFSGSLDYIFYTKNINPLAILPLPTDAQIAELGFLPTQDFASDHLILMAQFQLKPSKK